MIGKYVTLYEPSAQNWTSIEELNNALNWTELISQTGAEYFEGHGVSQKFTNELIEALTRVNYGQVGWIASLMLFLDLNLCYSECR